MRSTDFCHPNLFGEHSRLVVLPASRAKRCRFALAWRGGTLRSHSGLRPKSSEGELGAHLCRKAGESARSRRAGVALADRASVTTGVIGLAAASRPSLWHFCRILCFNQNGVKREDAKIARVRAHRDMRALVAIRSAFHRYALRPTVAPFGTALTSTFFDRAVLT